MCEICSFIGLYLLCIENTFDTWIYKMMQSLFVYRFVYYPLAQITMYQTYFQHMSAQNVRSYEWTHFTLFLIQNHWMLNLWWVQLSNWFKWVNVNFFFRFQIHTTKVSFKAYWFKNGFEKHQSKYQDGFCHMICMFILCKVHFDIYIDVFEDQNLVNVF